MKRAFLNRPGWQRITYCISYRTSARRGTDPMNGMSHLGFRTVMTPEQWKVAQARERGVASR